MSGITFNPIAEYSGKTIGVTFLDGNGHPTNVVNLSIGVGIQPVFDLNGTPVSGIQWYYNATAGQQCEKILGFLPQSSPAAKYYSYEQGFDTISNGDWGFLDYNNTLIPNEPSYSGCPIVSGGTGDTYTHVCDGFLPGTYQIAMTWLPDATLATNVPVAIHTITSNAVDSAVTTVTINQSVTPSDFTLGGVAWKILGSFTIAYPTTGFQFTITNPGGKISFDSLQVARTSSDQSVTIQPGDTATLSLPYGWANTAAGPVVGPAGSVPTVGDPNFTAVAATDLGNYNPSGSPWTFSGAAPTTEGSFPLLSSDGSGVGVTGSTFVYYSQGHAYGVPNGTQFGFLQAASTISQSISGWAAGNYAIAFQACGRWYNGSATLLTVSVDGAVVGTFSMPDVIQETFTSYSTLPFAVAAGSHTIEFSSTDISNNYTKTIFLLDVAIEAANGVSNIPLVNTVGISSLGSPNLAQVPKMGLGYNVEADYNPCSPILLYTNLATRVAFGGNGIISLNANGYPTLGTQQTLQAISVCYEGKITFPYGSRGGMNRMPAGLWTLEWDGTDVCNQQTLGDYTCSEETGYQILGQTTGNRRILNLQPVANISRAPSFWLEVTAAAAADGSGHYAFDLSNLKIYPPDPSDPTGMTPWASPPKWWPTTLGWLDNAYLLRCMTWLNTNSCTTGTYADLRLPGTLNAPSRTISATINTISNVTGTPFFAQVKYCSVQVSFTAAHGFFESAFITLVPAQQLNYSDSTNSPASQGIEGFVHVIDAETIEFQQIYKQASGTPITLTAPGSGGSASISTGVNNGPWLDFLDLCTAVGAGAHVSIPIGCNDACITQMAQDCAARLPTGAKVHVEWGNEHWNFGFAAFHWLLSKSYQMTGSLADPTPAYVAGAAHAHSVFRGAWVAANRNATDMIRVMGSQGAYNGVTSNIVSAATTQGVTFDQVDVSIYLGNQPEPAVETAFGQLYDQMTKDQILDFFDFNLRYGLYETELTAHTAVLQGAGLTTVKVGAYEAGMQTILPGTTVVNGFERSYEAINHPRIFGQQFYWQQRMQDAGGANNMNIFYLSGGNLSEISNGVLQGTPQLWATYIGFNQANGTGNPTLDSANLNNPLAVEQVKSEVGGAIAAWQILYQSDNSNDDDNPMPTLNWGGSWSSDTNFNPVSIAPSQGVVGSLISQAGKAMTAVSIAATLAVVGGAPAAIKFDPREIYVAFLRDIDGTNYETPPNVFDQTNPNPAVSLASALPTNGGTSFGRVFLVPSTFAPGFRVYVYCVTPGGVVSVTVKTQQA